MSLNLLFLIIAIVCGFLGAGNVQQEPELLPRVYYPRKRIRQDCEIPGDFDDYDGI